jgi:hypothetical protein
MQDKLSELEKRVTALEISRGETSMELKSINGKLDTLIRQTETIVENFVSTPTCEARQGALKNDVDGIGAKVRGVVADFNNHIQAHWGKADRYVIWINTALLGLAFSKLAKLW